MKKLKEHHDFYIDKAREWKIRALKLENIMNHHGVAVPERHAGDVAAAQLESGTDGALKNCSAAVAMPPPLASATTTAAGAVASREKENNAPTPTEDLQLCLEPGAALPFKSGSRNRNRSGQPLHQQDCNTQ
jgi:ribosomal protein L12E/L44/L45/RPP1/RPP2